MGLELLNTYNKKALFGSPQIVAGQDRAGQRLL
jgi:hypothetical protein